MRIFTIPCPATRKVRPQRATRPVAPEPPVPRPFDFGFTASRPLVPLPAVLMFLNKRSPQVLALIEEGKLRWAFDIRTAGAATREIRVLRQSLFEYTRLCVPDENLDESDEREFAGVVDLILPADKPDGLALRGTEVARCFSCTPQHVLNLVREKSLRAVDAPRKAHVSPPIVRASVVEFLKKRRMS
jgi:hypothetical protein